MSFAPPRRTTQDASSSTPASPHPSHTPSHGGSSTLTTHSSTVPGSSSSAAVSSTALRFRTFLRNTILDVFRDRGYVETPHEEPETQDDWDVFWADKSWMREHYDVVHLRAHQRLNHFRNYYELTRKDLVAKNINRARRAALKREHKQRQQQQQQHHHQPHRHQHSHPTYHSGPSQSFQGVLTGSQATSKSNDMETEDLDGEVPEDELDMEDEAVHEQDRVYMDPASAFLPAADEDADDRDEYSRLMHPSSKDFNFLPRTFVLPEEYLMFVELYKRHPAARWIMKPIGKSQGKGIFLFQKLSQISEWRSVHRWKPDNPQAERYIVQRYLDRPLLVGLKKFDMRIYCLVTSYSPLKAYLYRDGFARFTNVRFTMDDDAMGDSFVHLTNVAVQKKNPEYDESTGGKWSLHHLKTYLQSRYGYARVEKLFLGIKRLIILSLRCVQNTIINDKHCFELYGYDVMIDENLKPWLIEVNASPSLSANTDEDYELKYGLLQDTLSIVDMEGRLQGDERRVGGFDLIFENDEPVNPEVCRLGSINDRTRQLNMLARGEGDLLI